MQVSKGSHCTTIHCSNNKVKMPEPFLFYVTTLFTLFNGLFLPLSDFLSHLKCTGFVHISVVSCKTDQLFIAFE